MKISMTTLREEFISVSRIKHTKIVKPATRWVPGWMLSPVPLSGAVLFASGTVHLLILWMTQGDWEGPMSLRKPGLFGVSAGMTIWSLAWAVSQIKSRRNDSAILAVIAGSLFLEVTLITLQYWRGVPSHFNRTTNSDAAIESLMLGLIAIVVLGIVWLDWRSMWLSPMPKSRSIAIRSGLRLLSISCMLGIVTTIAGEMNISRNQSPEIWGRAGVIKYPHGAVLHAIQVLPLISAALEWLQVSNAARLMIAAVAAHYLFLAHALWQSIHGRARFDVDVFGGLTLAAAGILVLVPVVVITSKVILKACNLWIKLPLSRTHHCD